MDDIRRDSQEAAAAVNTSRVPRGEITAAALVRAVVAGDDRLERHYLEIKGPLNLAQKNDLGKIAKFILGAANRMPDVAARAFEGYGVMVIGVSDHHATGVPPVEVLEIAKFVSSVIGADGPKWDVVRVPADEPGNEVLLVLVDPPQNGHGPFVCRRSSGDLVDGRIYVRNDGETKEATAEQLDQLFARGHKAAVPTDPFEVTIVGEAHPVTDGTEVLEAYVAGERRKLLAAVAPKPPAAPRGSAHSTTAQSVLGSLDLSAITGAMHAMSEPESRTPDEYRAEVDDWERALRAAWPGAVHNVAGLLPGVSIRIRNRTETFFRGVELTVHLDGQVRGVPHDDTGHLRLRDLELPDPPRLWGPTPHAFGLSGPIAGIDPSLFRAAAGVAPLGTPRLDWHNSGSVDLTFRIGDLRPRGTSESDDDELTLVLPADWNGALTGTWTATAQDHHVVFEGKLEVQVGAIRKVDAVLRELLKAEQ